MNDPQMIGKYHLESLLGEGGMGRVFKAFDPRVRRHLAIKILRQEGLNQADQAREFKERFFREGQICGRLNHQNIVIIYEMDEAHGQLFIAMEYVQGQPLSKLIGKEDALSYQDRMKLLNQVADALDYAHRIGVVHRDIKPSNIIWRDSGQAKVTDFGMAKLTLDNESNLTRPGMFMGTPRYASPEQINGQGVCAQSDVFSFGILAYELISGSSPFPGSSISEILFKIAACQVSYEPIEKKLQLANSRLKEIFSKVFMADPDDRYPSAGAFMRDLEPAVEEARGISGTRKIPLAVPEETVHLQPPGTKTTAGQDSTLRDKPVGFKRPEWANTEREPEPDRPKAFRPKIKLPDFPLTDPEEMIDTPPRPGGTLRIPKSFIDPTPRGGTIATQRTPTPPPPPPSVADAKPASAHPAETIATARHEAPSPPTPPPLQAGRKTGHWVPKNVPSEPAAVPVYAQQAYEPEEEPGNYWWLLGVLAIASVIAVIAWLAWPELKTIWADDEPVQTASQSLPLDSDADQVPEPASESQDPAQETPPSTLGDADQQPGDLSNGQPDRTLGAINDQESRIEPDDADPITTETNPPNSQQESATRETATNPLPPVESAPSRESRDQQQARVESPPLPKDTAPPKTTGERKPASSPGQSKTEPTPPLETRKPVTKPKPEPKTAPIIVQPVITHRERPVYPSSAREAGIEGKVVLEAELRFDGRVGNISILQNLGGGTHGFEDAAVKALLGYRFVPGQINGKPSTMRQKFSFDFDLKERQQIGAQRVSELANETLPPTESTEKPKQFGIVRPVFYHKVAPIYPSAGSEAGLSGSVILRANLRADGQVDRIVVVQGLGNGQYGFEDAAIAALKQWKFHPGTINGEPTDMPIRVSLQFQLQSKGEDQ